MEHSHPNARRIGVETCPTTPLLSPANTHDFIFDLPRERLDAVQRASVAAWQTSEAGSVNQRLVFLCGDQISGKRSARANRRGQGGLGFLNLIITGARTWWR